MGKASSSPERMQDTLLNLVTNAELTFSYVKIHSGSTGGGSRFCMYLDLAFISSVTMTELQRGSV